MTKQNKTQNDKLDKRAQKLRDNLKRRKAAPSQQKEEKKDKWA